MGVIAVLVRRKFAEIKSSKPFYPYDLIVYIALIIVVALTFAVAAATGGKESVCGFTVIVDNRVAAEYSFDNGRFTVKDGFADNFDAKDTEIYFFPDANDKSEYNLIAVDIAALTVYVKESTCAGHDCEKQKITEKGGFIYCAPHKLKIVPAGLTDPVSG